MSGASGSDVDTRREQLAAELARLDEQEQAEADQRRQREQAERDAQLAPDQLARKAEIERLADEALDREYPPAWLPQKENDHPDKLVGAVLRIDPRVGPSKTYSTYSAVIEVRALGGQEWTIWANEGGALYAQLLRLRIQPGEVIAVKYRGLKDSEANPGQTYHDFKLARIGDDEGPGAPIDYDALNRGSEPPALPPGEQAPVVHDDIPF